MIKEAGQDTDTSKYEIISPSIPKGKTQISSTEKHVFSTKEEFVPSDQISTPNYILNLIAQIVTIILCLLLSRMF